MARQVTITLDDDVAALMEDEARRTGTPLEQAVAGAVRRAVVPAPFRIRAFNLGKPLIDLECTGHALEEQDRLEALEKSKRSDEP
jgi:hypothetical protein